MSKNRSHGYLKFEISSRMKQRVFSIKSRMRSFKYAINGLKILWQDEHNARIHVIVAIAVVFAGVYFKVSVLEWVFLVFAIGLVIILEIVNSSIENIGDFISPEKNDSIKKIKDLSAAGVLVGAITAAIVGLLIFIPKIL